MLLKNNKKGFASLIEVIITSILFTIATVGILAGMTRLAPNTQETSKALEAAQIGKRILDDLRASVDARTWSSTDTSILDLSVGTHTTTINQNGVVYTINYTVSVVAGFPSDDVAPRKVTMTITYPN